MPGENGQPLHRHERDLECNRTYFALGRAIILLLGMHQGFVPEQAHLLLPNCNFHLGPQLSAHHFCVEKVDKAHFVLS